MGIALSAVIGGYLAAVSLSLPIIVTLIPVMLGLLLTFFLVEPRYHKDSDAYTHLKQSFRSFIGNKQIVLIATGILMLAAVFDSFNALNPVWYSFKNVPIEMFGWITSILFVLASVGYHESHRFAQYFGDKPAIMLTTILPPITVLSATFFDRYQQSFSCCYPRCFLGTPTSIRPHCARANKVKTPGNHHVYHSVNETFRSGNVFAYHGSPCRLVHDQRRVSSSCCPTFHCTYRVQFFRLTTFSTKFYK